MLPTLLRNMGTLSRPSMNDFIDRFFYGWPVFDRGFDTAWSPHMDIHETDKELLIDIELPGIDKNDIKVEVKNNVLTISGERKYENKSEEGKTKVVERRYGEFTRSFSLPGYAESGKISAAYKKGVLTLTIPKSEKALPKSISIEVK